MRQLLDHGSIEIVEAWGSDERIIEAARMSTGKGFLGWGPAGDTRTCLACQWTGYKGDRIMKTTVDGCFMSCPQCGIAINDNPGDERLLRYLYENNHATPFEMAGMVIEVKAPIMVFREWHRHRTQSYNEMSARYTPLPNENYTPTVERCMVVSGTNKQAGAAAGAQQLTHDAVISWLEMLAGVYTHAQQVYEYGLSVGIPKELARLPVPVARYSRMRASANLRNWLAFMTLRSAPSAQYEIRVYSQALHDILAVYFPRTIALFDEASP